MYNPDDDVLQEIQSSDSDEDNISSSARSKAHSKEIRELVHVKLSQLHEIISDDEGDELTSPIGSPPAEISALGGRDKFLELRRKLEEDQAKNFEAIQPIQVTDVETLLESFRSERDQSRSSSARIEANPKFLELYQQVKDRDHRILDLETKLMEQNRKVVDLEDNLSEKEKLLSSKNEAVSVVQQKFEAELRLKKDELEKSQRLLFELERNLGKVQDQWKEDKNRFNAELQKQEEKYQKLLDSNKSLESTRFQLTTQMAELQEQLVHLAEANASLLQENTTLKSSVKEHSEKFVQDQEEFEKAKEQLDFDQELLEREKEILEKDLKALEESKNSFQSEFEEFQLQKSIFQEENQALAEEKIAVSRERELIESEKEQFYSEKEQFESQKEELEKETEKILVFQQELQEKDKKIQELTETNEKLQANLKKLKVQFQTKLKALKEEKAKEKEQEEEKHQEKEAEDQSSVIVPELEAKLAEQLARITELLNKVTELEEEKGNLLLRLVDFDEHQDLQQLKESLSSTEVSLSEKTQSLAQLQTSLDSERENLSLQKQALDTALTQLSSDQSSLETLKESLAHHQESLEKDQESLRAQQETLEKEKDSLAQQQLILESTLEKLSSDLCAFHEEKLAFNKERENENMSLNFEREALRAQSEQFQQEQEQLRSEREDLKKAQADLSSEKETLRTDKQGLAMERETWQWQSQEAEDLRANLNLQETSLQPSTQSVDSEGAQAKIQELTSQVQELTEQLEVSRNNVKKLKIQFQTKLKQIREKASAGASVAPSVHSIDPEKLTELQNKVAELEEEKGQLLLRLVDFEELQATHETLMNRLASMDQQLKSNEDKIRKLEQSQPENFQEIPLSFEPIQSAVHAETYGQFPPPLDDPFAGLSIPAPLPSIDSGDEQVQSLSRQIEILESSLQTKAKKIGTLEEEVKSLEEQIEFNREDFSNAVADFDRAINKKNQDHAATVASLEAQVKEKETEIDNLKQMLLDLEEFTEAQGLRESKTKGEASENRKFQDQEHSSLDKAKSDDHEKSLASLESQLQEKQLEIDNLKQMLDELEMFTEAQGQREQKTKGEASESRKIQDKEHLENQELLESQEEKQIEILRLTGENADLYRQLEETTTKLSEKERDLASTQAKLDALTLEFNAKKSAEEENLHELLELQEVKENLEKSLEASTEEVARLNELNAQLQAQIAQVSESLQTASTDYRKMQVSAGEVPALQLEIEKLNSDLAHLKSVEARLSAEVSGLKEQLLEKDEEFEVAGKELGELRTKVQELTEEILGGRAALEPLQAEISALKAQLVEKDEELEFTNDQIMTLSVKSGQAEKVEKALQEAQSALANKQFEVDRLLSELSLLNEASMEKEASSREEHVGKLEELQRSADDAQARILCLEEELKNAHENNGALQEEIQARNSFLEQSQPELEALRAEVERLKEALSASEERTLYFEQLEDAKVKSMALMGEEIENLTQAVKASESALKQTESALKDLDKALKEAVAAKEVAILELVQTRSDFDEVLRKQLESAIAHALQEKDSALREHESSLEEKNGELRRLRDQLSDVEKLLESANSELKGKEDELEFTREEMSKLTEALNHVEKVVLKEVQEKEDQMKVQVSEMTTLVNEKDQEIKKIMADFDGYYNQARVDLEAKTKHVEALEQSLFEKNEALTKVEETLRELRERHQAEMFETIEKHNEEEESLFARIGALNQENIDLKTQLSQIQAELMEARATPVVEPVLFQSAAAPVFGARPQQPSPNPFQQYQNQSSGDFFDTIPLGSVQEPLAAPAPSAPMQPALDIAQVQKQEELLAEKEKQIYEQSVLITELEITVDDLRAQLSEITELKMELEVLQHQNVGLSTEVQSLRKQIEVLQSERTESTERSRKLQHFLDMEAISGPKEPSPAPPPSGPVAEEPMVRATAYTTTDKDPSESSAALLQEKEAQITALSTEVKELKIKSGRVLQKLRQTTNKYEELQKAHEALKTKSEFSLESALEGEISDQLKKKDAIIAEKTKLIQEIQAERVKLLNQVDVFERANDKLTEGKENQDRMLDSLSQQKKSLEQEIQGLKWKLEEVEEGSNFQNTSLPESAQGDLALENNSLRVQNSALVQEIDQLQQEVNYQRQVVANLQYQLEQMVYNQGQAQAQAQLPPQFSQAQPETVQPFQESIQSETVQPLQQPLEPGTITALPIPSQEKLEQLTQEEIVERHILEQKIELLQNKISELEANETRYYEELQKTRAHAQQLDMENLNNQDLLLDLNRRLNSTERDNLKSKILQEEVNRLILILDEKDNAKCDQVTSEIIRLQEEKAVLEYQVATFNQQQELQQQQLIHAPTGDQQLDSLLAMREKLAELERKNIMLEIDLRREINARRIVQEQLFFKQASKSQNHKLGILVGNPWSSASASSSPSRGSPMPSPGFGGMFSTPSTSSQMPRVATPDSSPKLQL